MLKSYFITNNVVDEDVPSSTYCHIEGKSGRGRYKGASNCATAHNWWVYSAPQTIANDLRKFSVHTIFDITEGELGHAEIKIRNAGGKTEFKLTLPTVGNDVIELEIGFGGMLLVPHIGHTIADNDEFRTKIETPVYSLEEEKKIAEEKLDQLYL